MRILRVPLPSPLFASTSRLPTAFSGNTVEKKKTRAGTDSEPGRTDPFQLIDLFAFFCMFFLCPPLFISGLRREALRRYSLRCLR